MEPDYAGERCQTDSNGAEREENDEGQRGEGAMGDEHLPRSLSVGRCGDRREAAVGRGSSSSICTSRTRTSRARIARARISRARASRVRVSRTDKWVDAVSTFGVRIVPSECSMVIVFINVRRL